MIPTMGLNTGGNPKLGGLNWFLLTANSLWPASVLAKSRPPVHHMEELDWSDEIPFTHLEIVTAHNIGEVELRQGLSVQVDYRWQRLADHGSALIVWFSGALILTKADCTARLQDTQGVERAQALAQQGTLTFSLADVDRPETLTGWTVVCDYRKERFIDARFAVVLHPPAPGRRSA